MTNKILDTSDNNFLAPTTLIPLIAFALKNNIKKIKTNKNTSEYVSNIFSQKSLETNTPLKILPKTHDEFQNKRIAMEIIDFIDSDYAGKQTIHYVISELVNNIYSHTPFNEYTKYGYLYAQSYPTWKKVEICVYDDGLSIPGRLEKSNITYEDDCQAIEKALGRFTTITNRNEERGNGLGTCMKLIEANEGSAIIVSREGCLEIDGKKQTYSYHHLNNKQFFEGTLITFRFRNNPINFYEILDDGRTYTNPYKYKEEKINEINKIKRGIL